MSKIIKWLLAVIVMVPVLAIAVLFLGSYFSLDRSYLHSTATRALPDFAPDAGSGMVQIAANNMSFRARVAGFDGDATKPTILLLHGFPVTSAMWLDLIEPLARQGFKVVAFDQRGYSPGARPSAIEDYSVDKLTDDVLAVADVVGAQQFHLVGHDWGAGVGWSVVLNHPQRVISWTGLSIAHPQAFGDALINDPDQQARSAYFAFFQLPFIPQWVFTFNDMAILRALYQGMSETKLADYEAVFSEPDALSSGLNWYRAMAIGPGDGGAAGPEVSTPTLFLWGNQDQAVGRAAIEAMETYMTGPYRSVELTAGHWLFVDARERVVQEIVDHVAQFLPQVSVEASSGD